MRATPVLTIPHHDPMKKTLTIQTVGDTLTLTVLDPHDMDRAMLAQEPNHALRLDEDGSVLHLNCRQVIAWAEEDAGEDEEAEEPQKMVPDPDPSNDPDRTVAQLKDALDAAEVEYPSNAVKADLQTLAREHKV